MAHLLPITLFLMNLKGDIRPGTREYRTPERALEALKQMTGEDFGYDVQAWKQWLRSDEGRKAMKERRRQGQGQHLPNTRTDITEVEVESSVRDQS